MLKCVKSLIQRQEDLRPLLSECLGFLPFLPPKLCIAFLDTVRPVNSLNRAKLLYAAVGRSRFMLFFYDAQNFRYHGNKETHCVTEGLLQQLMKSTVPWLDTVRPNRAASTVAQADVTCVARSIQKTRELRYQKRQGSGWFTHRTILCRRQ